MLRIVLSLTGLMWASSALAEGFTCPRLQTSRELESRIAVAMKATDVRLEPDFLTIFVCGSGRLAWASLDTKHQLQADGAELWSRLSCHGGFRRGKWSCTSTDVRGIRVAVSGFKLPVQVTIPPDRPVTLARERIASGFADLESMTVENACDKSDAQSALRFDSFRQAWALDEFTTFQLDGGGNSYLLSAYTSYLRYGEDGSKCWGEWEVVFTSQARLQNISVTYGMLTASPR